MKYYVLKIDGLESSFSISDEHLSEMVLEYNNIVKYKTNFTGDTGMYLESDKKGYLIVDGRFKIQARNEMKNKKIQVVAVADEYHQLFVDGRSGSILDVAIDGIGIIVVLIIIRVIFTIYLKQLGTQEVRYE